MFRHSNDNNGIRCGWSVGLGYTDYEDDKGGVRGWSCHGVSCDVELGGNTNLLISSAISKVQRPKRAQCSQEIITNGGVLFSLSMHRYFRGVTRHKSLFMSGNCEGGLRPWFGESPPPPSGQPPLSALLPLSAPYRPPTPLSTILRRHCQEYPRNSNPLRPIFSIPG